MITRTMCSWCHEMSADRDCENCGHRADLPRLDCDCAKCRRHEQPRDESGVTLAVGDLVEFVEPYQGVAGGVVAEVFRGIMGPMAGVRIAPGRTADTLCRRLRKAVSQ